MVENSDWIIKEAEASRVHLLAVIGEYGHSAVSPGTLALLEITEPNAAPPNHNNVVHVDFSRKTGE